MNVKLSYETPEAKRLSVMVIRQAASGDSCNDGIQSDDPDACLDGIAEDDPF